MAADTPQARERQGLNRQSVFTAAMAADEVQRRFVLRQRQWFALQVLLGFAAMWSCALWLPAEWAVAYGPALLVAGAVCLLASFFARAWRRGIQVATFWLGLLCLGAAGGTFLPASADNLALLLNPTLLVGSALLGSVVNAALWNQKPGTWADFLWSGPWLVLGCTLAFLFPAGTACLSFSGLAALVLVICLHRSVDETLAELEPGEALVAAADAIPVACLGFARRFIGRD